MWVCLFYINTDLKKWIGEMCFRISLTIFPVKSYNLCSISGEFLRHHCPRPDLVPFQLLQSLKGGKKTKKQIQPKVVIRHGHEVLSCTSAQFVLVVHRCCVSPLPANCPTHILLCSELGHPPGVVVQSRSPVFPVPYNPPADHSN